MPDYFGPNIHTIDEKDSKIVSRDEITVQYSGDQNDSLMKI